MDSKSLTPDQLPRRLGVFSAAAVVVGAIIGSGIFGVTAEIANGVGTVGAMALAWLTGGLITLCLAWSMAELSAMYPSAGGTYVYLREAFGPMMAFLFGWIFLLFAPAGWAGIAAIFSRYAAPLLGVGHDHEYLITIGALPAWRVSARCWWQCCGPTMAWARSALYRAR